MDGNLSLSAAAKLFPTESGKPVSLISVRRWCKKGVRDVRLRCVYSGGRYWTRLEWVEQFTSDLTQEKLQAPVNEPAQLHIAADRYLKERYGL